MIVNLGSDAQINSVTNLASGTYTNKASAGGTFTVSNGKITGFLGGGKIAVLYEAEKPVPQFTIDAQEGGFYSDTLTVKMTYSGATTATYTLNGGTATTFNSGDTVTFGAGAAFGTTFVLKLTASNDAGQSTKTFTFTKEDPNAVLTVHYYKPSSWGTPNIYFYDDTITPTKIGAIWPGVAMTSESNGWYGYRATGWKQGKVIFNSGSNQIPGASQPGYSVSGEKWIKDGVIYSTNPNVVTPGISIDKTEGIFYGDSLDVTVSLKDETAATYTLNGGAAIAVTSGQKITIGAGDAYGTTYALTVNASNASKSTTKTYTFVKTKQVLPAPTVTIDKPEGTFYSDKLDVTVSFTNASAATYSLNGAEPAALTSGQKIMIGSGDSYGTTYTLIVNAYNEDNSTTKTYTFVKTKQELPAPIISIDKAEGTFTTDSLDVTVTYKDATVATYSLNGAEPAALASGQKITIGAGDTDGSTYTLTVIASNEDKSTTKTYTFKKQKQQSFTVHFYNPTGWSTPNIYFYDETVTPKKENATWPGTAMSSEGNGWYFYTITGWDNAYVMFNSNGKQTPAANQPGYLISKSSWIKDGVIADQQPVNELVPVTFVIKNATTYYGQNVYITGNLAELGDWDPAKAIGPASNQSYTDWSITINLPEGTTIEFKAIKKEGDGIVWEGGSNHSYKVSSSNPVVEFYFYN
jgi:alpha-amylase